MDDQEEVARLFGKYNLVAAPVVDTENRLVGVITVDDVVDVIEEEADEDLKALGGVTSHEELSDNVWTIAKAVSTGSWSILPLPFWPPRCSACSRDSWRKWWRWRCWPDCRQSGGNAATQTMTVAVRAVATRELAPATRFAWSCARAWSARQRTCLCLITGVPRWPGSGSPGSAS